MGYIVYGIIVDGYASLSPTVDESHQFVWSQVITWSVIGLMVLILVVVTLLHVIRSPGIFNEVSVKTGVVV